MAFLKKCESLLEKAILAICAAGMAAITIIICIQVLYRYGLGHSLSWAEELSLYIEVYVVFLAAGYALGSGQHIRMDLIVSKVPWSVAVVLNKLTDAVCLVYSAAMTVFCTNFMLNETSQKMAALPGYKWMIYLAMVIGSLLMVLYSIILLLKKPVPPNTAVTSKELEGN